MHDNDFMDFDGDGIIDAADFDDDNDGLNDLIELESGTDPLSEDTDEDKRFWMVLIPNL